MYRNWGAIQRGSLGWQQRSAGLWVVLISCCIPAFDRAVVVCDKNLEVLTPTLLFMFHVAPGRRLGSPGAVDLDWGGDIFARRRYYYHRGRVPQEKPVQVSLSLLFLSDVLPLTLSSPPAALLLCFFRFCVGCAMQSSLARSGCRLLKVTDVAPSLVVLVVSCVGTRFGSKRRQISTPSHVAHQNRRGRSRFRKVLLLSKGVPTRSKSHVPNPRKTIANSRQSTNSKCASSGNSSSTFSQNRLWHAMGHEFDAAMHDFLRNKYRTLFVLISFTFFQNNILFLHTTARLSSTFNPPNSRRYRKRCYSATNMYRPDPTSTVMALVPSGNVLGCGEPICALLGLAEGASMSTPTEAVGQICRPLTFTTPPLHVPSGTVTEANVLAGSVTFKAKELGPCA